ncbi:type I methionyl aminopeptidase [Pseudoalteromonas xiamenensis]
MSNVVIKSADDIDKMRASGKLLAQVFAALDAYIRPGLSTMDVNDFVEDYIVNTLHARPASKGQYGFAYVLNSSPNNVVCHGVPSQEVILQDSDIINIDITLEKYGFITDSSKMYVMPKAPDKAKKLVDSTIHALWEAISLVKPDTRLGDLGAAIQSKVEKLGYSVVREYCGHGIGRQMHEEPNVLHYGSKNTGMKLKPGMTFTIEPMVNEGTYRTKTLKDGWTVITTDGGLSAQAEHTLLVTDNGVEVLTLRDEEHALHKNYLGK